MYVHACTRTSDQPCAPTLTKLRALTTEAIGFFGYVGDPNVLGLFRRDNATLDDKTPLANYDLAEHEVHVMRQWQVGGGAA